MFKFDILTQRKSFVIHFLLFCSKLAVDLDSLQSPLQFYWIEIKLNGEQTWRHSDWAMIGTTPISNSTQLNIIFLSKRNKNSLRLIHARGEEDKKIDRLENKTEGGRQMAIVFLSHTHTRTHIGGCSSVVESHSTQWRCHLYAREGLMLDGTARCTIPDES